MSAAQPHIPWQRAASILWFPISSAILPPLTFENGVQQPTPQKTPITVDVGGVRDGDFDAWPSPYAIAAIAAVRDRTAAAAYVAGSTGAVSVARAAWTSRASHLQGVVGRIAALLKPKTAGGESAPTIT